MKENEWKKRLGVVYSTNSDFDYDQGDRGAEKTLPPEEQELKIRPEKKGRKGKVVTVIKGFRGSREDIEILARILKKKCGSGGSVKEGEIIIQGDFCDTIIEFLKNEQYNVKRSGG